MTPSLLDHLKCRAYTLRTRWNTCGWFTQTLVLCVLWSVCVCLWVLAFPVVFNQLGGS